MEQSDNLSETVLASLRSRITRILPSQIRACIEELTDDQLWWRPNEHANSVGNLVLHLSGSMRHYLSRGVGHIEYSRNRPAEFAERGPVPRAQLLDTFNETIRQAEQVLNNFDTSRLLDPTDEPDYVATLFDTIFNVSIHLATHAGQIVYVTKMLKEGSLDELWIKAHKRK
ncbi:MAG TPA: DinB family protein [Blastocatellia bacterium]|nr:DinB family protein [Blastocatellia bacterium]